MHGPYMVSNWQALILTCCHRTRDTESALERAFCRRCSAVGENRHSHVSGVFSSAMLIKMVDQYTHSYQNLLNSILHFAHSSLSWMDLNMEMKLN